MRKYVTSHIPEAALQESIFYSFLIIMVETVHLNIVDFNLQLTQLCRKANETEKLECYPRNNCSNSCFSDENVRPEVAEPLNNTSKVEQNSILPIS